MHEINCIATQRLVLKIGTEFLFVVYDFNKKNTTTENRHASDEMLLYILMIMFKGV